MLYNINSLPFDIEFRSNYKDEKERKQTVSYVADRNHNFSLREETLIIFREQIPLGVSFHFKDSFKQDDIEEAKLVFQSGSYDEYGKQENIIIPFTKEKIKNYNLFDYKNNQDFPWRLGIYFFEIYFLNDIYICPFTVLPIHFTEQQVKKIHFLLESQLENICYELVYTTMSTAKEDEFLKTKSYYDYAMRIINQENIIKNTLIQFGRKINGSIQTSYKKQFFQKKIDNKSLKFSSMKNSQIEFNKKKIISFDNSENRWIKHVLYTWKNDIINVVKLIINDLQKLNRELKIQDYELELAIKRKKFVLNEWAASENSKKATISNVKKIEEKKRISSLQIALLQRWSDKLQNIVNLLSYTLETSELNNLEIGKKKPNLKLEIYRTLTSLYEYSHKIIHEENGSNQEVRVLKPTWKIFEYYVYFQVIQTIKNLGFEINKFSTYQLEDLLSISSGSGMNLENEEFSINIWYDRQINLKQEADRLNDNYYSTQNMRPDIRIDLYQKEQNTHLSTLILEIKHKRFRSLYNSKFTTSVVDQLSKYRLIYYSNRNLKRRNSSVIDKVLCIYSFDESADVRIEGDPDTFIQLFPDMNSDLVIGQNELLEEIQSWMDDFCT